MTHQHKHSPKWSFWVDRGGTFTDIVARQPNGELVTCKLLSENPHQYDDAVIQGIRTLMQLEADDEIPTTLIEEVKMGTTVATNALLEHKGEDTLLITTKGFADVLRIGYQTRPDLFAIDIKLPEMIYRQVLEVDERVSAQGEVLISPDPVRIQADLRHAWDQGLRSCAIVLMHSYQFSDHEELVARLAAAVGFEQISVSSRLSPLMKIVSRGDTTVADAYLSPILRRYVDKVAAKLGNFADQPGRLMFMQSNGGLTDARIFNGKDAILSGPAGGVVGMVQTAATAGFDRLIGFDMGGTSTDVCHYQGEYERSFETEVAGFRLQTPMMSIHTVAAGGGSILTFDGSRLRVGPDSAGAFPGPACYRNGGPLTVTDCNVMLGKLQPSYFPKVFGPHGNESIDASIVMEKFQQLSDDINRQTGSHMTPQQVAEGFLTIAVENMANAIKHISTQRGYDVQHYTLCCFGGAGGQHACLVADALGMKRVFLHPYSGVLSAFGMGLADIREINEQSVEQPLTPETLEQLQKVVVTLARQGREKLHQQRVEEPNITTITRLHLKYAGSDTSLLVPYGDLPTIRQTFEHEHQQRFGFIARDKALIIEAIQVESIGGGSPAVTHIPQITNAPSANQPQPQNHTVTTGGNTAQAPFYLREQLSAGIAIKGPAVIIEANSTIVIEPGWQGCLSDHNDVILERMEALPARVSIGTDADPVMLEIFNNLYMHVAEQMGLVLQNTAVSVNIKERLDFSCAIFDQDGELVANAPHVPVHLGSMSHSIKTVIENNRGQIHPGDVFMLNDPYHGGTHLPDITVIKPVFDDTLTNICFYVAARGHHADVGGITPGSMPSDSTHIEQEGILLDNIRIVAGGEFQEQTVRGLLLGHRYPVRNIDYNIADLRAQIAACESGTHTLQGIVRQYGLDVVQAYMKHVQENAEECVRRVIDVLADSEFSCTMDDGSEIHVAIRVDRQNRAAHIDFGGTSPQHPQNYNAPLAVTHAAVLYTFRCLVNDQIPLNGGCLRPLHISVPTGSMLNPQFPAAVVAGNVEVSQAVVDALFGALDIAAASQGTMNNVTWGNERYQYYETLCGGSGASLRQAGASAVHTHMTNSRLTDPEVLEWRFPVRLEEFCIRHHSGGSGHHRGGDGVIRKTRFLETMDVSILSNRREIPPYGLAGGEPGQVGHNTVVRTDGQQLELGAKASARLQSGDILIIATPGGGGFGQP
ncbi:hydantoinase B/oxoprolinase family protein [Gynuella sunshinyii]|uniref:N-methylhydantoinase B/acetone carboxylase, alpha subunit n=1 Tax=Gynuella sunshinyii YC6258 TaxID=1445510 RepID=A0A0C5VG87_9GAMM|nr:hydantoinase B/oxoprolinase family protein [Gynuella sunshinyii]AJQ92428.1 N-methylhydantoinase B/acetone carboxylase, alpha subunit [Gynuella sunshinyii YC6258]